MEETNATPQPEKDGKNQPVKPDNLNVGRERVRAGVTDRIIAGATLIIAAFAVVTACLTIKTINEQRRATDSTVARMDSQISVTSDQEKRQLRAYVGFILDDSTQVSWDTVRDTATNYARFSMKNFGQTPAYHVTVLCRDSVLPKDSPDSVFDTIPKDRIDLNGSHAPIFPGDGTSKVPVFKRLKTKELKSVISGKCHYFIWGVVRYDDAFGKQHATSFRFELGGGMGEGFPDWWDIGPSIRGNESN